MPKVKGLPAAQFTGTRPELPDLFTRYSEQVQAEFCSILPNGSMELSDPFRYHLGWADESGERLTVPQGQGKALISSLCLFACQALDGDWMQAVPAATALELTHNFSLIHDDIQDGDTERRHRPTVWRLWGQPKALLVGDAMHAMAYQVALDLVERGVSVSKALRSSRLFVESCLSMIKGQSLDLEFEDTLNIGLADYLEMIRLKTGALFTCSLEIGALLASDEAQNVQAFARYGNHLGPRRIHHRLAHAHRAGRPPPGGDPSRPGRGERRGQRGHPDRKAPRRARDRLDEHARKNGAGKRAGRG